jgi:predicted enzyme related to lactoylglutathione lyase
MSKVVHFEIPTDNPEKCMDFYSKIFGWKFNRFGEEQYWLVDAGPKEEYGIGGAIMKKNHPDQPLTNAINVESINETAEEIKKHGCELVVPKTEIPNMGWFAYFKDPDNNIMGLWENLKK